MGERVRLRPERPPASERGVLGLAALLLVLALVLVARPWWAPGDVPGLRVEVRGEVARPGWHIVRPATLSAAVEVAGGLSDGVADTPLHPGDAVLVRRDGVRIVPSGDPLLVGLPVDVNRHGADALAAVPGISEAVATAIVDDRARFGHFQSLDDLARVPGLSPARVDEVRPFLTAVDPEPPPIVDLNAAPAQVLATLPGVGPSLAERIVGARDDGPFASVDDLVRVRGIGPATVERLRPHVEVGP